MKQSNNGKSPENALTPSALNLLARRSIEKNIGTVWLTGEVTDLYLAHSGHAYFSIKDQQSSVKCTFFKQYNFKKVQLNNGDNVLVFGKSTLYEERGTFQLKVERVETSGVGEMSKAFAKLKIKLESLGYFKPESKKILPSQITSLGIVTSQTSAAIKDVLNVIKRRNPLLEVKIYHASVQGDKAIEEIIDALFLADINNHDVILLTRGGGSEEDLWTFNDVSIAQTLFNLATPCVTAIGHERDTSIADLVADVAAITPSAAAELLTPDIAEIKLKISHWATLINKYMKHKINNHIQQLDISYHQLENSHPINQINKEKQRIKNCITQLTQAVQTNLQKNAIKMNQTKYNLMRYNFDINGLKAQINYSSHSIQNHISHGLDKNHALLSQSSQNLNTLSPLATLSRGYGITINKKTQSVITHIDQISVNDTVETRIDSGKITSVITLLLLNETTG